MCFGAQYGVNADCQLVLPDKYPAYFAMAELAQPARQLIFLVSRITFSKQQRLRGLRKTQHDIKSA